MSDERQKRLEKLVKTVSLLTDGQLYWLDRALRILALPCKCEVVKSDLLSKQAIENFGDAIRIHHSFSAEPLSKDRFEYILANVLNRSGHEAQLAPKGLPGRDIVIDGCRLSLKTQADRSIKADRIHISKLMELGKGQWGNNLDDLIPLRDAFLEHLKGYERILVLRALDQGPQWCYELVEIPKVLLEMAANGKFEMSTNSKQNPKPGYCHVRSREGEELFRLYFDGGSERKLQGQNIRKCHCILHATWQFFIPPESDSAGRQKSFFEPSG